MNPVNNLNNLPLGIGNYKISDKTKVDAGINYRRFEIHGKINVSRRLTALAVAILSLGIAFAIPKFKKLWNKAWHGNKTFFWVKEGLIPTSYIAAKKITETELYKLHLTKNKTNPPETIEETTINPLEKMEEAVEDSKEAFLATQDLEAFELTHKKALSQTLPPRETREGNLTHNFKTYLEALKKVHQGGSGDSLEFFIDKQGRLQTAKTPEGVHVVIGSKKGRGLSMVNWKEQCFPLKFLLQPVLFLEEGQKSPIKKDSLAVEQKWALIDLVNCIQKLYPLEERALKHPELPHLNQWIASQEEPKELQKDATSLPLLFC